MVMPQPLSWAQSALESLESHYGRRRSAKKTPLAIKQDFQTQEFRTTFFRVIGHKYVMAIQRILTADPATRRFTQAQWCTKLGVNRITVWRWKNDINFAEGEKFFAAQLLLANLPVQGLNLPDNSEMLMQSILCMWKELSQKYNYIHFDEGELITPKVLRIVHELMSVMASSKINVYNPHDASISKELSIKALKFLAVHLTNRPYLTKQSIVLPSEVKLWLDNWGTAYSLFALGNHLNWTQLRVKNHE